jgi:hypothetical protein
MKYGNEVFMSVFQDFNDLQSFSRRQKEIAIINVQKIDDRFYIFYNSTVKKEKEA